MTPSLHKGMIVLMGALIVSALLLVSVVSISFRTRNTATVTLDQELTTQTNRLAMSCMEHALMKLSNQNIPYTGNETLTVGTSSCIISPITTMSSTTVQVITSATKNYYTQQTKATIDTTKLPLRILSWDEQAL